jgi:hypothetical protein
VPIGDGREIWVVNFDLTIIHYIDDFCLTPYEEKLVKG